MKQSTKVKLVNLDFCYNWKSVPRDWFPEKLDGLKVFYLASRGGQQGPALAAAGADVIVTDISQEQLKQDENVAKREGLTLKTVQGGDMSDLSDFKDEYFDIIINPVSNLFVKDVKLVWNEVARVFKNKGILDVKNAIPSSTLDYLPENEVQDYINSTNTIEYAHTLEDQIQGQAEAGLVISGFYEDDFGGTRILDEYIKTFIATRAIKLNDI